MKYCDNCTDHASCDAEDLCHYTGSPFTPPDPNAHWDDLMPDMVSHRTGNIPVIKWVGYTDPFVIVGVAHTGSWAFIRKDGVPTRDFAQATRYDNAAASEQAMLLGHYARLDICSENCVPALYKDTVDNKLPLHNPNVTITAKGEPVLIWSGSRQSWWGPDSRGYVTDPRQAGKYTLADAIIRTRHAGPGSTIHIEDMPGESAPPDRLSRTQASVKRISDADDAKMPDGARRNPNVIINAKTPGPVVIWSGGHNAWWRSGGVGYTNDINKAGQWLLQDAIRTTKNIGQEEQVSINDLIQPDDSESRTKVVTYVTFDQFDEQQRKTLEIFNLYTSLIDKQKQQIDLLCSAIEGQQNIIKNHEKILRDYVVHRHFLDQPRLRALLQDAEGTDPIKTGPGS